MAKPPEIKITPVSWEGSLDLMCGYYEDQAEISQQLFKDILMCPYIYIFRGDVEKHYI